MKTRRILAICLTFILTAAMVLSAGAGNVSAAGLFGNKGDAKTEGEGYATPEEAVIAYLQGMKDQDIQAMLSTFAVESFCESFDLTKLIGKMAVYSITNADSYPLPAKEKTLNAAVNIEKRRGTIVDSISRQLLVLTAAENGYFTDDEDKTGTFRDLREGKMIPFNDTKSSEKIEDFVKELSKAPDYSKIEIKEVIYGEVFMDQYLDLKNLKNSYSWAKVLGADGYKSLALHASFEEYDILLFMEVLRYNGRWYNYQPGGLLATLLNMDVNLRGMAVASPEISAQWDNGYKEIQETLKDAKEDFQDNFKDEWEEYCEEVKDGASGGNNPFMAQMEKEFAKMSYEDVVDFFALTELAN